MNKEEYDRYSHWIDVATIRADCEERVKDALERAHINRRRLTKVASDLRVPWQLLAAIQELEASGNMNRHPANGDPLTARTTHIPAGLPTKGEPPFTYEGVVAEELAELQRPKDGVWTLQDMCHAAEHFNGTGYRARGIASPYVVAATTLEEPGRYIRDKVWDESAWSDQVGALALWIAMRDDGEPVP